MQPLAAANRREEGPALAPLWTAPVFLFMVYRLALDLSYRFVLSPIYGYMGYTYSLSWPRWLGLWVLSVCVYGAFPRDRKRPSFLCGELLLWVMYAPCATFYALSGRPVTFFLYLSLCFLLMGFLLSHRFARASLLAARLLAPLTRWGQAHKGGLLRALGLIIAGLCGLLTVASVVALFRYADLSNWTAALNLLRIYEIRAAQSMPSWTGYLFSAQTKVVNIFILCVLYQHKRYWAMLFPIALQLLFYVALGNKADLFGLVLCVFAFVVCQFRRTGAWIGGIFAAGTLGVSVLAFLSRLGLVPYSLFRRTFFTQPLVAANYYDFFSTHTQLHFSEGRIGRLLGLSSPYPVSSAKLIMGNYSGNLTGGANSFFLSSGYADMGFAGMLVYCVLLALILRAVDRATQRVPVWFSVTVLSVSVNTLCNSSLFTTLGNHGMLVALVLLALYGLRAWLLPAGDRPEAGPPEAVEHTA